MRALAIALCLVVTTIARFVAHGESTDQVIHASPIQPAPDLTEWNVKEFMPLTWSAPFLSGGGYCSEAMSFAKALAPFYGEKLSIQHHGDSYNGKFLSGLDQDTMMKLYPLHRNPQGFDLPNDGRVDGKHRGAIHICHSEPGAWALPTALYSTAKCPHARAAIKIGRTMFETDRLPKGWIDRLNQMHFIWVPTNFAREIFAKAGVEERKLVVIPEPVDTDFYSPAALKGQEAFVWPGEHPTGPRPFRFLSIFKFEERKAWDVLVRAFVEEFATNSMHQKDSIVLYILTSAYHSQDDFAARIKEETDKIQWPEDRLKPKYLPRIQLVESGVPEGRMPALYAGCDAFVLPSRGEGWGRPHVEAMSMEKPVIATHWSGPSEFLTEENGYPLRHVKLVKIKTGAFKGHKWAQPSSVHLRQLMRRVVENPTEASERGKQARRDMVQKYCQPCVAKMVIAELARVQDLIPLSQRQAVEIGTSQSADGEGKDEL